ncbi:uncharacterized protein N7529_007970 [Penicillium soppii]|uniref:uncharacterized protein n=1 Tax=Penicillium soppii TaxID=69789 RepID=UPI00254973CE|nr:uncharacterized protein N7529_007970 [Penicillium soppii]KAJ5860660.1 hypothetical protein N7529_007970 [Penicillium soppii]
MDGGRRSRLKSPLTLSVRQCDSKELLLRPIVEISRLGEVVSDDATAAQGGLAAWCGDELDYKSRLTFYYQSAYVYMKHDQLEVDGWLLERGEQDASLDPFPPGLDAVIIAQRYIPAVENWLRREVENPDDVSPVDGDVNP